MISVVNQEEADRDIPKLLATPAAWRGLSMEPLLGPVSLTGLPAFDGVHGRNALTGRAFLIEDAYPAVSMPSDLPPIDWVIVGGESGRGARPMHPAWPKSLRDQCVAAGVPFFFKQ
jgi:protein gp37